MLTSPDVEEPTMNETKDRREKATGKRLGRRAQRDRNPLAQEEAIKADDSHPD